ncbi:hypothetical protein B0H10DRAFT_2110542 [Mycena sp. CBHHK59/15]|nr:hypothetical protein B0H10DRAFT_2110542 [Mycena sp. CBHHK59/15]
MALPLHFIPYIHVLPSPLLALPLLSSSLHSASRTLRLRSPSYFLPRPSLICGLLLPARHPPARIYSSVRRLLPRGARPSAHRSPSLSTPLRLHASFSSLARSPATLCSFPIHPPALRASIHPCPALRPSTSDHSLASTDRFLYDACLCALVRTMAGEMRDARAWLPAYVERPTDAGTNTGHGGLRLRRAARGVRGRSARGIRERQGGVGGTERGEEER